MGVGKTTVGRTLARQLRMPFIDADAELEKRLGVKISWIFDIEGEEGFRLREKNILRDLVKIPQIILATGGGVVLDSENRSLLQGSGMVVYLKASPDTLYRRTKYDKNRPLLQTSNRRKKLKQLFEQRDPLYMQVADLVVRVDKKTARQVAKDIVTEVNRVGKPA
ncbi:MAG: shikimate kinase [Gammaproteobacteria bacterium]|nr:MAG: shikimate kinase [Gammaproteobacteria bacterium]